MCGIVGYIGEEDDPVLGLDLLKRLEYRGYDSAGMAVFNFDKKKVEIVKAVGPIDNLGEKISRTKGFRGSPSIWHCLPPDTLVQLEDGRVLTINKVQDGMRVASFDCEEQEVVFRPVKVFKHEAPDKMIRIKTPSSFIECTKEHKMFVIREGEFRSVPAGELKERDVLVTPKKLRVENSKKIKFQSVEDADTYRYWSLRKGAVDALREAVASYPSKAYVFRESGASPSVGGKILYNIRNAREDALRNLTDFLDLPFPLPKSEPVNSHHGNFVELPRRSTPEVMRFLGYAFGDGYVGRRNLRIKDTRPDVLRRYQEISSKIFNLKGNVRDPKGHAAQVLEINSKTLSKWLKKNVFERKDEFIEQVGSLPDEELAAFVGGLFDADGFVSEKSGQVALTMNYGLLVRNLRYWLLRFGVLSSIIEYNPDKRWGRPNKSYRISISNYSSLNTFKEKMGFVSREKQMVLEKIVERMSESRRILSWKWVPIKKPCLRKMIKENIPTMYSEVRAHIEGSGYTTRPVLQKVIEKLRQNKKGQRVTAKLTSFIEGDAIFQEVRKLEHTEPECNYLYDLEVEGTNNFWANGFLSHNSRWATHGQVTEANAHPHFGCKRNIFLVHNGIIENHQELRVLLEKEGHRFTSQTDTEVLAHLIEKFFRGNLESAVRDALRLVEGAYGLVVMSRDDPEKIVAARNSSPILLGLGEGENLVASDAAALADRTKRVIYLDDQEMAVLTKEDLLVTDLDLNEKDKLVQEIDWEIVEAQRSGYPHFMLKEIFEQPDSIKNCLRGRLVEEGGSIKLGGLEEFEEELIKADRIIISACGTSYYAGLVGEYMIERMAGIPVEVEFASEFRYRKAPLREGDVFLAISQSGETADTLGALEKAESRDLLTLGIVNVVGSSIAKRTRAGIYLHAGPEIGVASTKAFTSQLTALALLSVFLGRGRGLDVEEGKRIIKELGELPDKVERLLKGDKKVERLAKKYAGFPNFLFLGRGVSFPVALEGALKLKEVSYVHAEGYGAGELKHGPLALIDEGFPTVVVSPRDSVFEKTVSNVEEIRARGGKVIGVTTKGGNKLGRLSDDIIYIPETLDVLSPVLSVIPLQLFAYYTAVDKGLDPDKPRNLAKSVTVE